jgi:hypothetical protein
MSDRAFTGILRTIGGKVRVVAARARLNGSSDGVLEENPGNLVASVVHSATGLYTVTLAEAYQKALYLGAHYGAAGDGSDLYAQCDDDEGGSGATPRTVVVRLKTGASNTDPPGTPNGGALNLLFIFEDSGAY